MGPLHQWIADELRRGMAGGESRSGDPLPSEHKLCMAYGVSRGTVRQALAALRAERARQTIDAVADAEQSTAPGAAAFARVEAA
jgi:GntR family transcriptional regulator